MTIDVGLAMLSIVQYSGFSVLYNTTLYSTVQYCKVQYCTTQDIIGQRLCGVYWEHTENQFQSSIGEICHQLEIYQL